MENEAKVKALASAAWSGWTRRPQPCASLNYTKLITQDGSDLQIHLQNCKNKSRCPPDSAFATTAGHSSVIIIAETLGFQDPKIFVRLGIRVRSHTSRKGAHCPGSPCITPLARMLDAISWERHWRAPPNLSAIGTEMHCLFFKLCQWKAPNANCAV